MLRAGDKHEVVGERRPLQFPGARLGPPSSARHPSARLQLHQVRLPLTHGQYVLRTVHAVAHGHGLAEATQVVRTPAISAIAAIAAIAAVACVQVELDDHLRYPKRHKRRLRALVVGQAVRQRGPIRTPRALCGLRHLPSQVVQLDDAEALGVVLYDAVVAIPISDEHPAVPRFDGLGRLAEAVRLVSRRVGGVIGPAAERREDLPGVRRQLMDQVRAHVSHPQTSVFGLGNHVGHHEHARAERPFDGARAEVDERDGVLADYGVFCQHVCIRVEGPCTPVAVPPIEHPYAIRVHVAVKQARDLPESLPDVVPGRVPVLRIGRW